MFHIGTAAIEDGLGLGRAGFDGQLLEIDLANASEIDLFRET